MLTQAFVIALSVLFIYTTMQEGMIFEKLGNFFKCKLPEILWKPVFDCPICMTPWYGTIIYFILFTFSWKDYLGTIFTAAGIACVFVYFLRMTDYLQIIAEVPCCQIDEEEEDLTES